MASRKILQLTMWSLFIAVLSVAGQQGIEDRVLDRIKHLPEVKERAEYVKVHSNNERHLQYTIFQKPTKQNKYYWVKVLEDNGEMYHAQFNFYVNGKTLAIKYFDPQLDTVIDYKVWKKMRQK
jgi:hypothetical protein